VADFAGLGGRKGVHGQRPLDYCPPRARCLARRGACGQ
jgi:hypothetical protein